MPRRRRQEKKRFLPIARPQVSEVGLQAWYKLYEQPETPTTVFDYSLNGNQGTVTGATPQYPGFLFNGTTDNIAVADSDSLDVTSITMAAWAKSTDPGASFNYIIAKTDNQSPVTEASYYIGMWGDGDVQCGISNDGASYSTERTDTALSENVWHRIVCTYTSDTMALYVDGSLVATTSSGVPSGDIFVGTGKFTIGARRNEPLSGYADFFVGELDGILIYDRAFTASETQSDFETTRGRYGV